MTYMDDVLFVILAVLYPIYSRYAFARICELVRAGGGPARMRVYRGAMAGQWFLLALALVAWVAGGRSWAELGIGVPDGWGFVAAGAATALLTLLLWRQAGEVAASPETRAQVIRQMEGIDVLIPREAGEYRLFVGLSATAGICEETLYRGFLMWYLAQWAGPLAAALGASVIFGLAHAYQGRRGVIKTGLLGLALAVLYLLAGSLWPAMVAHFMIDALSGLAGKRVLAADGRATP